MKHFLILISLLLWVGQGTAQRAISVTSFLEGAAQEESVANQNQKHYFLNSIPHNLAIIEKIEFRTETNNFDFRQQDYLLRVSPNSPKNLKTQRQHQQMIQFMSKAELEVTWGEALWGRYELLIKYIYTKEILEAKKKQGVLLNDKVTLQQRSIALEGFNVLDLIDAEDELQKNVRGILDLENAVLTYEKTMLQRHNSNGIITIDGNKLVNIQQLKAILRSKALSKKSNHPVLDLHSAKVYSSMLEHEWEAAKSKFSLGYVQAKYGYDPQDNFKKNFSIGVGFDIPFKSLGRLDLNALQIEVFNAESDYRKTENELTRQMFALYHKSENLIEKFELVQRHLKLSSAEFALKEYSKIAEASPMAMLKLRENTLDKELLLAELTLEIVLTYIAYLDVSGVLIEKPLRNYLFFDLDKFRD